jgi:hypothetical protein
MSKEEARRLALEYVEKQLVAMPKRNGHSMAKIKKSRKEAIVASLVKKSKHLSH